MHFNKFKPNLRATFLIFAFLEIYRVSVVNVNPYPEFVRIAWFEKFIYFLFLTSLNKLPDVTYMHLWSSRWKSWANYNCFLLRLRNTITTFILITRAPLEVTDIANQYILFVFSIRKVMLYVLIKWKMLVYTTLTLPTPMPFRWCQWTMLN